MNDLADTRAEVLMLVHVTAALWANFINNSGGDVLATCRRVAKQSLESLDGIYERLSGDGPNPGLHPTVQGILAHEESFWRQVEEQVRLYQERQSDQ